MQSTPALTVMNVEYPSPVMTERYNEDNKMSHFRVFTTISSLPLRWNSRYSIIFLNFLARLSLRFYIRQIRGISLFLLFIV